MFAGRRFRINYNNLKQDYLTSIRSLSPNNFPVHLISLDIKFNFNIIEEDGQSYSSSLTITPFDAAFTNTESPPDIVKGAFECKKGSKYRLTPTLGINYLMHDVEAILHTPELKQRRIFAGKIAKNEERFETLKKVSTSPNIHDIVCKQLEELQQDNYEANPVRDLFINFFNMICSINFQLYINEYRTRTGDLEISDSDILSYYCHHLILNEILVFFNSFVHLRIPISDISTNNKILACFFKYLTQDNYKTGFSQVLLKPVYDKEFNKFMKKIDKSYVPTLLYPLTPKDVARSLLGNRDMKKKMIKLHTKKYKNIYSKRSMRSQKRKNNNNLKTKYPRNATHQNKLKARIQASRNVKLMLNKLSRRRN